MSYVADIILLTSINDSGIEKVQDWLRQNKWPPLVEISDHAGGNKAMQCDLWAAAINHFPIGDFAEAIREIAWEIPDSVQLLVKNECDDFFTFRVGNPAKR